MFAILHLSSKFTWGNCLVFTLLGMLTDLIPNSGILSYLVAVAKTNW
jgi:hypothetical protein